MDTRDFLNELVIDIIRDKKLDVGTYIYNTENYIEYLKETEELYSEYILDKIEYDLLKMYFKEEE